MLSNILKNLSEQPNSIKYLAFLVSQMLEENVSICTLCIQYLCLYQCNIANKVMSLCNVKYKVTLKLVSNLATKSAGHRYGRELVCSR